MRFLCPKPVLPFIFVACALLCLGACNSPDPKIEIGNPIPEFRLPSLAGTEVTNASFEGKPVVLNFWATWCGPCVHEIPVLKEVARNSEVEVVSIALDIEGEELVRPFAERHGIGYTVLLGDMALFERFDGFAIPYTLVLDASGNVVSIYRGLVRAKQLERDLQKAKSA